MFACKAFGEILNAYSNSEIHYLELSREKNEKQVWEEFAYSVFCLLDDLASDILKSDPNDEKRAIRVLIRLLWQRNDMSELLLAIVLDDMNRLYEANTFQSLETIARNNDEFTP